MTILDVGTNIGYYLAVASDRIGQNGQIVGLEPDPELYRIALHNANSMKAQVKIIQAAASDKEGYADFYPSEVSNWGSLRKDPSHKQLPSVRVPTVTIDAVCEELAMQPHAIRMDIEGLEAVALSGAKKTLRRLPALFIELHLSVLSDAEKRLIASLLSGYGHFLALSRYYDWAYSLPVARRRSRWAFGAGELADFMRRRDIHPDVILFATR